MDLVVSDEILNAIVGAPPADEHSADLLFRLLSEGRDVLLIDRYLKFLEPVRLRVYTAPFDKIVFDVAVETEAGYEDTICNLGTAEAIELFRGGKVLSADAAKAGLRVSLVNKELFLVHSCNGRQEIYMGQVKAKFVNAIARARSVEV